MKAGPTSPQLLPARLLRLQNVQQKLLHLTGGHLVQVLGWHIPSTDFQFILHGMDDPSTEWEE